MQSLGLVDVLAIAGFELNLPDGCLDIYGSDACAAWIFHLRYRAVSDVPQRATQLIQ